MFKLKLLSNIKKPKLAKNKKTIIKILKINFILLFLLINFLIMFPKLSYGLQINEIMYNAKGSDNNAEWIELYNPNKELIDLTNGWFIADDKYEQRIEDSYGYIFETNATYIIISSCESTLYDNSSLWDYILNPISLTKFDEFGFPKCDKIGNNLKNSQDYIEIWNCADDPQWCNLEDFFQYNSSMGANGNGKSLQYICEFENIWECYEELGEECLDYCNEEGELLEEKNCQWIEAMPTPARENKIYEEIKEKEIKLQVNIDDYLFNEINYTKLFKLRIKNKDDCSKKENISILYDIYNYDNESYVKENEFNVQVGCSKTSNTGNFYPTIAGNYSLCGYLIEGLEFDNATNETYYIINEDISDCFDFKVLDTRKINCDVAINISSSNNTYYSPDSIKFVNLLNNETYPFKIQYWVESEDGEIIKDKITTLNTNRKSYSPRVYEKNNTIILKSKIEYVACNDTNLSNNQAEKIIKYHCVPKEKEISIEMCLDGSCSRDFGLQFEKYDRLFKIKNQEYSSCSQEKFDVKVEYNISYQNGTLIKNSTFQIFNISRTKTINTGEWQADLIGNFTICGKIINLTDNITENNYNCKNITIFPNPLKIKSNPNSLKFGDYGIINLNFNPQYFDYEEVRFLIYANGGRIVSDLQGEGITSNNYESSTIIEITNLTKNITNAITMPFFLKKNCNDYYDQKTYEVGLRVFRPTRTRWTKFTEAFFNLKVNGKNEIMCAEETTSNSETQAETQEVTSDYLPKSSLKPFTYGGIRYIINIPEEIEKDFLINVTAINYENISQSFDIWSYVYKGRSSLMNRTKNKQKFNINAKETKKFQLSNKITQMPESNDEYKVMIKIKNPNLKSEKSVNSEVKINLNKVSKNNPKIIDFYTLSKKFNKNINIYVEIDKKEQDNLTLILQSFDNVKEFNVKKEKIKINIPLKQNNLFIANLMQDNLSLDIKQLIINKQGEEIISTNNPLLFYSSIKTSNQSVNQLNTKNTKTTHLKPNIEKIVYESSSAKAKRLIPLFIVITFGLIIVLIILKKKL